MSHIERDKMHRDAVLQAMKYLTVPSHYELDIGSSADACYDADYPIGINARIDEAYDCLRRLAIAEEWIDDPDWCYECDRPKKDCQCIPTVVMNSGSNATIDNLDLPENPK